MKTRKEIVQYLFDEIEKKIPLKIISKKKERETVIFSVENDCKISFSLDFVMGGIKGKNSFIVSFSMSIYNPLLGKILRESFDKKDDNPLTRNLVLLLDSLRSLPKEWNVYERYLFSEEGNNKEVAQILLKDVECYFIPYCIPFIKDYGQILNCYSNPEFIRNMGNWVQFITGVACAILTNQESKIEEIIVPLAKNNVSRSEFLEFKKSNNYKKELVQPIKDYIIKNI